MRVARLAAGSLELEQEALREVRPDRDQGAQQLPPCHEATLGRSRRDEKMLQRDCIRSEPMVRSPWCTAYQGLGRAFAQLPMAPGGCQQPT